MDLLTKILLASLLSGLFGLVGGMVLLIKKTWVKKFSLHLISFAVGALLATAILDLLPEALELATEGSGNLFMALLGGIVVFFVLERFTIQFHPHHQEDLAEFDEAGEPIHHHATPKLLLIGDTVHNFIDGILITVTFLADPGLGILTAVAVAAHEIPQEIGDFSVMLHHGWSRAKVLAGNIVSALASVVGALAAYALKDSIIPFVPELMAFTAGVFIYIAIADLIPEVTAKTARDRTWHVFALLVIGIISVQVLHMYLEG